MATQPEYYSDGNSPRINDTELRSWTKRLGVLQSQAGADSDNNSRKTDTLIQIKTKFLKAVRNLG